MEEVGAPEFDQEDFELAKKFFETLDEGEKSKIFKIHGRKQDVEKYPLHTSISPLVMSDIAMPGSTDVGDVSYVVPTAQFTLATVALGTALHTWQATAQTNTSIALK